MPRRKVILGASCLLLSLLCASVFYFYTEPPIDPDQRKDIERILRHLRSTPIKGWKPTVKGNVLTLRRSEPVDLLSAVALPHGFSWERLKTYCREERFSITVTVRTKIDSVAYEKLVQENTDTAKAIDNFQGTKLGHLRPMKPRHTKDLSGYYWPETPADQALIDELQALIKSRPTHRLPDYYTDTCRIYMDSPLEECDVFYYREQGKECRAMWKGIATLFNAYPNTICPLDDRVRGNPVDD